MPNGKGILQERQAAPTNDSNQPFMIRQSLTQLRTVVKSIWADAKKTQTCFKGGFSSNKKTVLLQISAFGRLFRYRNCLPVACCGHLGGGGRGGSGQSVVQRWGWDTRQKKNNYRLSMRARAKILFQCVCVCVVREELTRSLVPSSIHRTD